MSFRLKTLKSEIEKSLKALAKIEGYLADYLEREIRHGRTGVDQAMVLAQALSNYYTGLETIFLRISQYFENDLPDCRWHQVLLDRMVLEIEGYRPRVLSDETRADLLEILKFRHFARYYYDLEYDWDKLSYLIAKFERVRGPVRIELTRFLDYLEQIIRSMNE